MIPLSAGDQLFVLVVSMVVLRLSGAWWRAVLDAHPTGDPSILPSHRREE